MPRYVVQRTFPGGVRMPAADAVVERNADEGVTWITSYVSEDGLRLFCIYEAPTPEAIRKSAALNAMPVDEITRVTVMSPYVHA
jgi:hypothetical protein